jgi:hypothetical protein
VSEPDPVIQPEAEVLDGVPVLAEPRAVEPARTAVVPVRQAAALAATGFVAGAATAVVVGQRLGRSGIRRRRRRMGALGDVVATNSFLVDVHLLRRG